MMRRMGNRNIILTSILSVFGGVFLVSGVLMVKPVSAVTCTTTNGITTCTASANAAVTVSSACSMSGGGNNTYTDTIPNGTSKDLGTTTIKTICNDPGGYAIYTIGYSDDTYGNNKLLASTVGSTYDIDTGTTASSGSWWGMKIGAVSGPYAPTIQNNFNSNTFHVVPTDYTMVASYASATDGGPSATGSSITADYRVAISGTQPADTYTGKVKYALVYPASAPKPPEPLADSDCPANSICYAPNAWDIEGTMVSITENPKLDALPVSSIASRQSYAKNSSGSMQQITSNSTAQLIAPNYSRSGYGFAGWSPDFDAVATHEAAVAANDSSMEPIVYGPNETIATGDVSTYGLILYPVWIKSEGSLQDSSKVSTLCGSGAGSLTQATYNSTAGEIEATLSSMTALTDQRDNNTYTVAKLTDGRCWLVENLKLNDKYSADSSLAQGYGTSSTYGNFIGLANSENDNFSENSAPANSIYSADGSTVVDIGTNIAPARMPRYNNNNINRSFTASYNSGGEAFSYQWQWYSYGNVYTWAAAKANTNYLDNANNSSSILTSICPAGWALPIGTNNTSTFSFSALSTSMGGLNSEMNSSTSPSGAVMSARFRQFPNNFVYSGYIYNALFSNRSNYAYYWSATASASVYSYTLIFYDSTVHPGTGGSIKNRGEAIRCVVGS